MLRNKLAALLPALLLIGTQVLADEPGQRPSRPRADQYPPQQQEEQQQPPYDPSQQYYCDGACGQAPMPYPPVIMTPVPLPPPIIMAPPILPPPIVAPPIVAPPILPPRPTPYYGGGYGPRPMPYGGYGGGWYGGRPGYGRPGFGGPGYGPRPTPYGAGGAQFRRMSNGGGCEIQRGNNGEVVVLSNDGSVLYSDRSVHAEENAAAMKTYYQGPKFQFCADVDFSAPRTTEQDI